MDNIYPNVSLLDAEINQDIANNADTNFTNTNDFDITIDAPPIQPSKKNSLFFRDGYRHIDFVLTYVDDNSLKKNSFRQEFERNLVQEGLDIEKQQDGNIMLVKIHAPWEILCKVAEMIPLKMPVMKCDMERRNNWCLNSSSIFLPDPTLITEEEDYYMAEFSNKFDKMFLIENKDTFFSKSQRSLIVHYLLLRTKFADKKIGVDKLVRMKVYDSAFSLHDGSFKTNSDINEPMNERQILYETWASPKNWFKLQPLDKIRNYFGEKVAIYFAWLGYYTYMLFIAAFVGIIVFIYSIATIAMDRPSKEICDDKISGNIIMCPLCDKYCRFWRLNEICHYTRLTYVFDNYATVFYAAFIVIWATIFLEFWKRQEAIHQYDWDMFAIEDEGTRIRPEFEAKVKRRRVNPVTGIEEPYLPRYSKYARLIGSISIILFMICCVMAAMFGIIMYRIVTLAALYAYNDYNIRFLSKIFVTASAAFICLIIIMILNKIYEKLAYWLTDIEFQRTDSKYETSFILKIFTFQFINYYGFIFYVAFFKSRFAGRPGNYDYTLGFRAEECDPAGCLYEVSIQLAIVMIGKQTLNNFQEFIFPKILRWIKKRNQASTPENYFEKSNVAQWKDDYNLVEYPIMGLYEEYLEMVIQYGFVTIFVAAFPLAPLFALLNNIIEIRLDAYNLTTQWRRPVAMPAKDIGIWFAILRGLTIVAIISNAFIIGITSEFIPKMVYKYSVSSERSLVGYINTSLSVFDVLDFQNQSMPESLSIDGPESSDPVQFCRYADYRHDATHKNKYEFTRLYWHIFCARLAFIILFEHCVFFLAWLAVHLIPRVPKSVQVLIKRECNIVKEAKYKLQMSTTCQEGHYTADKDPV